MKHLKIEAIVEKRFEKINEALEKARLHFEENDIGKFRVKVKKLTAVLHLIDAAKTHGHSVKLPQNIVKINQLFGAIRTLQMQQNHIQDSIKQKHIRQPEAYLKFLGEKILHHIEDADKKMKGLHRFNEEEEKLQDQLPKQLSREAMLQFVRAEGDALETLFTPVFPADQSFHDARKHLKNLLYVLPYVDMKISTLSPYKLLTSFEEIDDFTKLLGSFHDLDTALECLHQSVLKIEPDEDEKTSLRRLEQIWSAERGSLRVRIYEELQKISASGRTIEPPVEWPIM